MVKATILPLWMFALAMLSTGVRAEPPSTELLSHKIDAYYPGLCPKGMELAKCARRVEQQVMARPSDRAVRCGPYLILRLAGQQAVTFENRSGVEYAYAGYISDADVVVEVVEEGWGVLLVIAPDRPPLRLPGLPLFAPGGEQFAILSFDIDAGFRPNLVQVWSKKAESFEAVHEVEKFPGQGGPVAIQWLTPQQLKVHFLTQAEQFSGSSQDPKHFVINKHPLGWKTERIPSR